MPYLTWHFTTLPKQFLRIVYNLLVFLNHYFSVKFFLKTLFAPWRRTTFTASAGFNLNNYLETVISNTFSRLLSAIIKLTLISVCVILQILVLVIGVFIAVLLICLPVLTWPVFYRQQRKKQLIASRRQLLDRFKPVGNNEQNISAQELTGIAKSPAGEFLFSRLSIDKNGLKTMDLKAVLAKYPATLQDFYDVISWYNHAKDEEEEYNNTWDLFNLLRVKPLGADFNFGYTLNLDKYSHDLTSEGYKLPHLVGRNEELERITQILSRDGQNNVILVGEPGSGRHALVLSFALDVYEGKTADFLKRKKVLELNLNQIASEAKVETEIKGRVSKILEEAISAGNIILVIDNFEKFVGAGQNSIDLTDVLVQVFARSDIQLIAITDKASYHKNIIPNSAINKVFETVEINEISPGDTLKVLQHLLPHLEKKHHIFIPFASLKEIISNSAGISIPYPEKAIDILQEAAVFAASRKLKILTVNEVNEIISKKTKTPQGSLLANEKEILVNLENLLHKHIVNQEKAVNAIAQSLRRARLSISKTGRPLGTFLFLGPTGVGKTETAKTLARVYFASEKQMVRIDMSQYQKSEAISQLLGNSQTQAPGILTSRVRDNPFTVVLFDEIEKAGETVRNILLPVLDEGYVTDSFGNKVSFENTIIIGTSNAGSEFIREFLSQKKDPEELSAQVIEYILKKNYFDPEFINRFDGVIVFEPLTHDHLVKIARLILEDLNTRLLPKKISVNITAELVEKIVTLGFDPQFGARNIKRTIAEKVEDYIAMGLLDATITSGQTVNILL